MKRLKPIVLSEDEARNPKFGHPLESVLLSIILAHPDESSVDARLAAALEALTGAKRPRPPTKEEIADYDLVVRLGGFHAGDQAAYEAIVEFGRIASSLDVPTVIDAGQLGLRTAKAASRR